jgi:magnesium transporter
MPVTTSAGIAQPVLHAARLADVSGIIDPARPHDAEQRLAAGIFAWLDLEDPGNRRLRAFGESLGIDEPVLQTLMAVSRRPSFDVAGDSIRAVVPSRNWGRETGDILGVRVMFTERYLLTTHPEPCEALARILGRWHDLPRDVKVDGQSLLFFILDEIVGSFEPDLLHLDERLDQIQRGPTPGSHSSAESELITIRHELSETVQALGWYVGDLDRHDNARLTPGISESAARQLALHHLRGVQLRDAARAYRDECQDALGLAGADNSDRQGDFINILTVMSAVFLPLTFLTSYFGMNFGVITRDLDSVWSYVLLGIALPVATVAATVAILQRLISRMGLQSMLPSRRPARLNPQRMPGRQNDRRT